MDTNTYVYDSKLRTYFGYNIILHGEKAQYMSH